MTLNDSKAEDVSKILNTLMKEFQCSICLDILKDPVSITCGHFFCHGCIKTILKSSYRVSCPLCKKMFTKRCVYKSDLRTSLVTNVKGVVESLESLNGKILSSKNFFFQPSIATVDLPSSCSSLISSKSDPRPSVQSKAGLNENTKKSCKRKSNDEEISETHDKENGLQGNKANNSDMPVDCQFSEDSDFVLQPKSKKQCQSLLTDEKEHSISPDADQTGSKPSRQKKNKQQLFMKNWMSAKPASRPSDNESPSSDQKNGVDNVSGNTDMQEKDKNHFVKIVPCSIRVERLSNKLPRVVSEKDPYEFTSDDDSTVQRKSKWRLSKQKDLGFSKAKVPMKSSRKLQHKKVVTANSLQNAPECQKSEDSVQNDPKPKFAPEKEIITSTICNTIPEKMMNEKPSENIHQSKVASDKSCDQFCLKQSLDKENLEPLKEPVTECEKNKNECKIPQKRPRASFPKQNTPSPTKKSDILEENSSLEKNKILENAPKLPNKKQTERLARESLGNVSYHAGHLDEENLLVKSPGWSKVKQMNKDFRPKRFPTLDLHKHRTSLPAPNAQRKAKVTKIKTNRHFSLAIDKASPAKKHVSQENLLTDSLEEFHVAVNECCKLLNCESNPVCHSDSVNKNLAISSSVFNEYNINGIQVNEGAKKAESTLPEHIENSEIIESSQLSEDHGPTSSPIHHITDKYDMSLPNLDGKRSPLRSEPVHVYTSGDCMNSSNVPENILPVQEVTETDNLILNNVSEEPIAVPLRNSGIAAESKKFCRLPGSCNAAQKSFFSGKKSPEYVGDTEPFDCFEMDCDGNNKETSNCQVPKKKVAANENVMYSATNPMLRNTDEICQEILADSDSYLKKINEKVVHSDSFELHKRPFSAYNNIVSNPMDTPKAANGILHKEQNNSNDSFSNENSVKIHEKMKVVKRICLTIDEIGSFFENSDNTGRVEEICTVSLPCSDLKLQLAVSDQTLNISVMKVLKPQLNNSNFIGNSSIFKISKENMSTPNSTNQSDGQPMPTVSKTFEPFLQNSKPRVEDFALQFPSQVIPPIENSIFLGNSSVCHIPKENTSTPNCTIHLGQSGHGHLTPSTISKSLGSILQKNKPQTEDFALQFPSQGIPQDSNTHNDSPVANETMKALVPNTQPVNLLKSTTAAEVLDVNTAGILPQASEKESDSSQPQAANLMPPVENCNHTLLTFDDTSGNMEVDYDNYSRENENEVQKCIRYGNSVDATTMQKELRKEVHSEEPEFDLSPSVGVLIEKATSAVSKKQKSIPECDEIHFKPGSENNDSFHIEDPFLDSEEFPKSTPIDPEVENNMQKILMEEENEYFDDPDMIFAKSLVAPLQKMAKLMELEKSKTKDVSKEKSMARAACSDSEDEIATFRSSKRSKRTRQLDSDSSESECDSSGFPHLDLVPRKPQQNNEPPHNGSASPSISAGLFPESDDFTLKSNKNTSIPRDGTSHEKSSATKQSMVSLVDTSTSLDCARIQMEIQNVKANLKQFGELSGLSGDSDSDSEVDGKDGTFKVPNECVKPDDSFLSDDSKESSDLFTEPIPPTPPNSNDKNFK